MRALKFAGAAIAAVIVVIALLLAIAIGGIVLIHWRFGWFVGEHGTGGSEYSIALIVMLLVVAAGDTYDAALPTNEEYVPKA